MKNIHVLPTESFNPIGQQIWRRKNGGLFKPTKSNPIANNLEEKINLYITSDEEIKDGDWMIRDNENPIKVTKDFFWDFGVRYYKIILTTDQDLIEDGVQAIDDEFLEWFVKNPSCEEVKIKSWIKTYEDGSTFDRMDYEIIIPKEEPKQGLPIINGSYGCTIQTKKQEPKQETLEELKKWREEALIAHEINQKVIKKLMDEKYEKIDSEKKIDKILQKLEEIKIMINRIN